MAEWAETCVGICGVVVMIVGIGGVVVAEEMRIELEIKKKKI